MASGADMTAGARRWGSTQRYLAVLLGDIPGRPKAGDYSGR
ncbi:hypothetical protein CKAH01_01254 [Colletotrichum kahawae]|uniref:Uncharacterized protein n=1 Tax=Colletotrichum kahawae TaxID=34407 RepID=A0AAD9YDD9_COLKA|nr:hypothetical protein CKAH01_01254 [Colletotrichum kahawae]